MQAVTYEEVKTAVFSMHPEKSPGMDDLNPGFFQAFWSIVGSDVCKQFFDSGEMPVKVNCTLVCLISKIKKPTQISELRPISLCKVFVRIVSKVLAKSN